MPHAGRGEDVDDRRVGLPALDHQVGRDGPVGQGTDATQIVAPFGRQRLEHSEAARLGHRRGQFGPRDVGHRRLDDGVTDA